MMKRRKTKVVKVGSVKIGGGNPVVIQSMAKTDTRDVKKTIAEIRRLENAGCEIARVAVKDKEASGAVRRIKKGINIPLVADIHFDYRLALESIKMGADKIRINPGNMPKPAQLKEVIRAAKKRKMPIRIGLNSGSLPRFSRSLPRFSRSPLRVTYSADSSGSLPRFSRSPLRVTYSADSSVDSSVDSFSAEFVGTALSYIKLFENEGFYDIIISLKSSNVAETVAAYRKLSALCDYPLHLGVTAAGAREEGIVKSSIGIGALLLDGIGDTIRVSLTGDPVEEIVAAKRILQALSLRNFGPRVISCPTCGRCQVDLVGLARKLEQELSAISYKLSAKKPFTVALMGCEVNGPGEARNADIGIAAGKKCGIFFKKGKVIKKVKEKDFIKEIKKSLKLIA